MLNPTVCYHLKASPSPSSCSSTALQPEPSQSDRGSAGHISRREVVWRLIKIPVKIPFRPAFHPFCPLSSKQCYSPRIQHNRAVLSLLNTKWGHSLKFTSTSCSSSRSLPCSSLFYSLQYDYFSCSLHPSPQFGPLYLFQFLFQSQNKDKCFVRGWAWTWNLIL